VVSFTLRPLYPSTHWIEGWVGSRAGLDDVEKRKFLPPPDLERRRLSSQSLYRLSYPGLNGRMTNEGCRRKHSWPEIFLDGLRKTTEYLTQDNQCHCRYSNRAPLQCEPRVLLLRQPGPNSGIEIRKFFSITSTNAHYNNEFLLEAESTPRPYCGWKD
jgi:hypothetical protein